MKEEYSIVYSPEAVDDIRGIYFYIANELQAEQAAANQVSRIRQDIRKLSLFPEKHKLVEWEPWNSMGMRMLPVNNYVVYYFVDEDNKAVSVVRIFYSGRDVESIIKDDLELT